MRKKIFTGIILLLMAVSSAACGDTKAPEKELLDTGFVAATAGIYDSADTAVITDINSKAQTVTLKNMDVNKQYTLSYDGTTYFYDKYGEALAISQLKEGQIADLTFMKQRKRLNSLQLSASAWEKTSVSNYVIDEVRHQAVIGQESFACSDEVVVVSDGTSGSLIDLNAIDTLTFRGVGTSVYSVAVEQGHGYLRLTGDEYFYDGWIEVGNTVIQQVKENMLLIVPEGSHKVIISNKGVSGTKQITVGRNEEVELDVSDLKGEEPQYGTVLFSVTPASATLYIDGSQTDYAAPVKLEYGIHQMIVRASGYDTIRQYIKVGQPSAGVEVTMEQTAQNNSISGNNAVTVTAKEEGNTSAPITPDVDSKQSATSTLTYYVSIDAPSGVEAYLDGNYIGITPCNFKKEAGTHTLTLRKTGFMSKSYTLQIDTEQKNISYSFLELTAE